MEPSTELDRTNNVAIKKKFKKYENNLQIITGPVYINVSKSFSKVVINKQKYVRTYVIFI